MLTNAVIKEISHYTSGILAVAHSVLRTRVVNNIAIIIIKKKDREDDEHAAHGRPRALPAARLAAAVNVGESGGGQDVTPSSQHAL